MDENELEALNSLDKNTQELIRNYQKKIKDPNFKVYPEIDLFINGLLNMNTDKKIDDFINSVKIQHTERIDLLFSAIEKIYLKFEKLKKELEK